MLKFIGQLNLKVKQFMFLVLIGFVAKQSLRQISKARVLVCQRHRARSIPNKTNLIENCSCLMGFCYSVVKNLPFSSKY